MQNEKRVNLTHNLTDIWGNGIDYNPNKNDPSEKQFDPQTESELAKYLELEFMGFVEDKF